MKKLKLMLLAWVCIYPIINLTAYTLSPLVNGWHPLFKSLIQTMILVPIMVSVLGYLQKKFSNWLNK